MRPQALLAKLFRGNRVESSLDEELRFHLEARARDLERSGVAPEEARRRARLEFGGIEGYKEQCREASPLYSTSGFVADLRFGLRLLRRSPTFAILAVFCLTLGIGANAAVFSWIEGTVLRPYPLVAHEETLVIPAGTAAGAGRLETISWPDWLDFQKGCTLMESFIAEKITGGTLSLGDRAEHAVGSLVSANYFDALGIRPVLGRGFEKGEDVGKNAHPVLVISYQLWQEKFGGDPGVIGKTQLLNSRPYTIVGVAPKGFYGTFVGYAWKFWVPASMQENFDGSYDLEDRGARFIEGFARLKPGVRLAQAQQEISAVARQLELAYPTTNRGRGVQLLPLWQAPFNNTKVLLPILRITLLVAFFVLVIACANVGNLLLVRALARKDEMSVRLAVGAARTRLLRQLLTEGLILSVLALVGALVVARWSSGLLVWLIPPRGATMQLTGQMDWRVFALTAGVGLVSTLLFGLFPAFHTSHIDIAGALRCESGGIVGGRRQPWLHSGLVMLQVSVSFVLLVTAGLLLKSLAHIRRASPGFDTQGVLTTGLNLLAAGYDASRARTFQDELIERVQRLGGVESGSYARVLPFSYRTFSAAPVATDAYRPVEDERPTVDFVEIGPAYFASLGIPLVDGREFVSADNERAPFVAVVNETMARKYWPGEDPVGRRLGVNGRSARVVGIAKDSKYGTMLEPPKPFFYVPLRQRPSSLVHLILRTRQDPATLATLLAREIHAIDPALGLYQLITLREQVDSQAAGQQVAGILLSVFGGLALILATVGLYGVMSYTVSQGARELGLRIALGAGPSQVLRLVLTRGFTLTSVGLVLGLFVALATTRLLGYMLYNVDPRDPLSFLSAVTVTGLAAVGACLLPAWRATRTDPLVALRS